MESLKKYFSNYQWHLYWIVMGVSLVTILAFALPVKRLYKNERIRETAIQLMEESAQQYRLPLSDFFFTYVGKYDYRLCRRVYQRGKDPVTCDWFTVRSMK